jgi:hypothetical protein
MHDNTKQFYKTTPLDKMTTEQWESLCDGCGKCCLHRVEDIDTGTFYDTDVSCKLLDTHTCQCTDYPNRKSYVPDCISLTAKLAVTLEWLPDTCAYRLLGNGDDLPSWHPLITGDKNSVHTSGNSVQDRVINETQIDDLEQHTMEYFSNLT